MEFHLDLGYEQIGSLEPFNTPNYDSSFVRQDFANEYAEACKTVAKELSQVRKVSTNIGEGDFSIGTSLEMGREIMLIANHSEAPSPACVVAAHAALQALPTEYIIIFDAEPVCVCVRRDGSVFGYSADTSSEALTAFGFPSDLA